jgi:hypothetical protein
MEKYRVVQLKRDRISGWVVEQTYPGEKRGPRVLYPSEKKAKEVAARLNAQETLKDKSTTAPYKK